MYSDEKLLFYDLFIKSLIENDTFSLGLAFFLHGRRIQTQACKIIQSVWPVSAS